MEVIDFLKIYENSWNKLDAELIIPHLTEKYEYSSMWVLTNLDHDGFVKYIRGKFGTIRNRAFLYMNE